MKRFLCIWLPDWPTQRLAAAWLGPSAAAKPQVCFAQRVAGVDPWADREALEALAVWCERFSPVVAVEPSPAPDSLLLDITGLAHLFGGETAVATNITDDFARRNLTVRLGLADTLAAAWAVAHFHSLLTTDPSSFILHPSSFIIVPPGEVSKALRPLPIEALRLSPRTVELLDQLGIRRIGQLEALPRDELSSRFGPELLRRMDQATGRLAEPVPAHRPPPQLEADWSPEHPTTRRESIEAALEQLIQQVAEKLVRLDRGAMRLECRLDCTSGGSGQPEPVQVSVGLFRPTASAGHLFSLARMQLERLGLPGPVVSVHVEATATAPLEHRQQVLFSDGGLPRPAPRHLDRLVDRLSSRLGRHAVVGVRLLPDAQPELAYGYYPLVGERRRRGPRRPVSAELPPRPVRLLPRPVALTATSIKPGGLLQFLPSRGLSRFSRSENGTVPLPSRFHFCGRRYQVVHTWGPERIETGWWRGRVVGRDYYRIETTTGDRFWLFRRLRDDRWFMHGMFE